MTPAQLSTLKAHILANPDPAVQTALAVRNDTEIARLYNLPATPAVMSWLKAAVGRQIFEATNVNLFDAVAAGKRDAWRMLMDFPPIDFGQQNKRNVVLDVWSAQTAQQRNGVLTSLTEAATVGHTAFGGTSETAEGVTALDRNFFDVVTVTDVSAALNLP